MIDVHVHLAALPDGKNGCYISSKMLRSPLPKLVALKLGLPMNDPVKANELYLQRLLDTLRASQHVKKAVLLGLDGVYKADGSLDQGKTDFLICNEHIFRVCQAHPDAFLPGVSINPQRHDALEELDRCIAQGAALVKWLPNTQQFDPANPAYRPFYKKLAAAKLPLLCHVGYEFSLWGTDQSVGEPDRLRTALDEGVIVIAAHGLSHGLFFYEKHWETFLEYVARYPNFYWDASALSIYNRMGMLLRISRHPELWPRMIFGTDYPLSCNAAPLLLKGNVVAWWRVARVKNPFDRHVELLKEMGLPLGQPLSFGRNA